jgi:hypothetical protein
MIEVAELAYVLAGLSDASLDASMYQVATGLLRSKSASKTSIINIAKQNICQYPILTSNNVCLKSYTRVQNMLEELYGTYLKMAIANNSEIIDLADNQSKREVISRVHQNDNLASITGFSDRGTAMNIANVTGGERMSSLLSASARFSDKKFTKKDIIDANQILMRPYDENFNLGNLNGDEDGSFIYNEAKKGHFDTSTVRDYADELLLVCNSFAIQMARPKRNNGAIKKLKEKGDKLAVLCANTSKRIKKKGTLISGTSVKRYDFLVNYWKGIVKYIPKAASRKLSEDGLSYEDLVLNEATIDRTNRTNDTSTYRRDMDPVTGNLTSSTTTYHNQSQPTQPVLVNYDQDDVRNATNNLLRGQYSMDDVMILTNFNNLQYQMNKDQREANMNTANINNKEVQTELFDAQCESYIRQQLDWEEARDEQGTVTSIKLDREIQKHNELEPTIMQLTVTYKDAKAGFKDTAIVVGVKCITHLIPHKDLYFYVPETLIKRRPIFKTIRWLTGEVNTANFVFDVDQQKEDAIGSRESGLWWRHLRQRSKAAKIRSFGGVLSPIIPNATLLMSIEDAEYIKIKSNIDLIKDTKMTAKLMDLFFFMEIVILDEANEEILLFNSDSNHWEHYTFDKLENQVNSTLNNSRGINLR